MLPKGKTTRGRKLAWRNGLLATDEPVNAWAGLLDTRGLTETDPFFSPQLADLPDPFGMTDMGKAAGRIAEGILKGEKIHIFGDFDADGVNGTAILLEALRGVGSEVSFSIPHRADDGHGIDADVVRDVAASGCRLGISVDTGTSCFDACSEAKKIGLDLIITDHHLPEAELPDAFALLNPARKDCGFADRKLCGTGVALFLLMAVWKRLKEKGRAVEYDLRELLDRVAVATVADVMDLVGVNRILVYHGLQRLNTRPSLGMASLIKVAKVRKAITTETIGFYLAPRINAAGRMRHGEEAMRLLSTHDAEEAEALASVLDETNKQRRKVEAEVFKQAEARLNGADTLSVYDKDWHAGVVGLAAGRLARKHGRPAAVGFVTPDGCIRVSLRGQPGFHVEQLLNVCSDYLEGFGGHAGAGGGTIRTGAWDDFVAAFGNAVAAQQKNAGEAHIQAIDGVLGLGAMHIGLAKRLQRFDPVGHGNPACTWLIQDVHITDRRDLKGGVVRLKVSDGIHWLDAIVFNGNGLSETLQIGQVVSLIGQLQQDDWRGGDTIQFIVEDVLTE